MSDSIQISGKIKLINQTQNFGERGFKKRELVLTTADEYPQMILIEFIKDKCEVLDNFKVGQDVTVSYNLLGREWINPEGVAKYFNSIQGWRIEAISKESETPSAPQADLPVVEEEGDSLPF